MASILDFSASSDSEDDVDYVPTNGAVSDSSFDEEDASGDEGFCSGQLDGEKAKTTKKEADEEAAKVKVDEKQRAKALWESFLNDVETVTPKKDSSPAVLSNDSIATEIKNESGATAAKMNTKEVCKVFEFAGETVTVDKDLNCSSLSPQTATVKTNSEHVPPTSIPKKRGLDSVLGTIMNKNKKLTVLDKSLLDWRSFKKDEGIDSELEKFNKGKQGFIERQRFLERSDLRSFEMEKSLRQTLRKK